MPMAARLLPEASEASLENLLNREQKILVGAQDLQLLREESSCQSQTGPLGLVEDGGL